MLNPVLWLAIPTFVFSLVIMWESVNSMLEGKSIRDFFAFFALSVALSIYTGAIILELFFEFLWMGLESLVLVSLIWILVDIWREAW